jgi:hypothetical protein
LSACHGAQLPLSNSFAKESAKSVFENLQIVKLREMQQLTASARENAYLAKESGNTPKSTLLSLLASGESRRRFLFFNNTSVPF